MVSKSNLPVVSADGDVVLAGDANGAATSNMRSSAL